MIWATDHKGNCTYVCQEWCDFTGQTFSEAMGAGWAKAVHPDDRSLIVDGFAESCRLQTEFMLRYRLKRHDGQYEWIVSAASPSLIPLSRDFIGFLGVATQYDAVHPDTKARVEIGAFQPGQAMQKFGSVTKLDLVADYLIQAKAVAVTCAPTVAAAIDSALHEAGKALVDSRDSDASSGKLH